MQQLKSVLPILVLAMSALWTTPGFTQATRIAYIDANKILKKMPEAQDANARLDQLVATWNQEAQEIQSELERKRGEFERRKLIMTDAERSAMEVDLQNLTKRLSDFRQAKYGTGGELFSQQQILMKSAYDKLLKTIEEVAGDGNYDYVLDKSSRDVAILYSNSKHDLTIPVAKKLGIETDAVLQPLLNTPANQTPRPADPQRQPPIDKNAQPSTQPGVPPTNPPHGLPPGGTPKR